MTEKFIQGKQDYKARLVVQGCHEDKGYIRTDAPTGSRDLLHDGLRARQDVESKLEQSLCHLHGPDGPEAMAHTHLDDFLIAFKKGLQSIQRCVEASCAHAPFETTVGHGRVVWSDHLQGRQPHKRDTSQVDAGPRVYEH